MMQEKDGRWMFSDDSTIPQWILHVEEDLRKAIKEHLQVEPQKK